MASHDTNKFTIFWTHGFVATLVVMVAIVGFCLMIPDSTLDNLPAARRRRRVAATEALVELDDVRLEREALHTADEPST
jgi:hypothetical protein